MQLAQNSLPKTNAEIREGIAFCTTEEGVRENLQCSAGKTLLLSDDGAFSRYATAPRTISLIFDGDALPLFAMPDGVSRVLASGGKDVLFAARYFAGVRRIGCALFPADASLLGVFERRGEISLGGERIAAPLAEGEIVFDFDRAEGTFAEAFARILLTRLAFFEAEALSAFGFERRAAEAEPPETREEIVLFNARARRAEAEGAYRGEGMELAERLRGPAPCWNSYRLLAALYCAFFEKGKPRRYFTPDYRARAKAAGTDYSALRLPSREEYAARALVLERIRARFTAEIRARIAKNDEYGQKYTAFGGKLPPHAEGIELLRSLPEFAQEGLSAIIRDFGLLDWNYDKGRITANG